VGAGLRNEIEGGCSGTPAETPMTSARHIVALLQSNLKGDDEQFLTVAMQAAAHEARQGHGKLAQQLSELVDETRARRRGSARLREPVPLAQPR
jgi:hypothetical protein